MSALPDELRPAPEPVRGWWIERVPGGFVAVDAAGRWLTARHPSVEATMRAAWLNVPNGIFCGTVEGRR